MVDDSGRAVTFRGSINPNAAKYKEELQIQVVNSEKGNSSTMMWNQEQFEDRLLMMRDALAA